MRVTIDHDPFQAAADPGQIWGRGAWPYHWIGPADSVAPPLVMAYRRHFSLDAAATLRVHVSADERYTLYLDGARIGRGSERGAPGTWFFESYDLALAAGEHVLAARVWSLGAAAPLAQMSVAHGFLVAPDDERYAALLGTGVAAWEGKRLGGLRFTPVDSHGYFFAVGPEQILDGAEVDWGYERGAGDGWQPVHALEPAANGAARIEYPPTQLLAPAPLPPMLDQPVANARVRVVAALPEGDPEHSAVRREAGYEREQGGWAALLQGRRALTLPAGTSRRIVIDLDDYRCCYPEIVVSGGKGSLVRLRWAEALYNEAAARTKGDRAAVDDKFFVGIGDTFLPDGGQGRVMDTLWWRCGRFVELSVATGAEPLTIERLTLHETRYPLELESTFTADDRRLEQIVPLMVRALQMCAHETYMDCPYYEQLMYAGDTRIEALVTYVVTADDRLPRKALRMFAASRLPGGLPQSRFPSRVTQHIPPFALCWIGMVYDHLLWRDDQALARSLLPGVREVLDRFMGDRDAAGLVVAPPGWNFVDWVPEWSSGVPPEGQTAPSAVINWQLAYTLTLAAQLEDWLGEPELAALNRRRAAELADALTEHFWVAERGLFADDRARQRFSEHAQCLALLSGLLGPARQQEVAEALLAAPDLARTTIYFSHYLFETYAALDRIDRLIERMQLWFDLPAQGFKTTVESPEPSRSDCHAWGAHPLYHYFASIVGIRPAAPGFRAVTITPRLGPLRRASATLAHPRGQIEVVLRATDGGLTGHITLPAGMTGQLIVNGGAIVLAAGRTEIAPPAAPGAAGSG